MATRRPPLVIDDTEHNVPDEFAVPDESEFEASNEPILDLDNIGFDDARDELERKRLLNPTGDWLKSEPWAFDPEKNISLFRDDKAEGDITKLGRTVYTLWGYPDTRTDKEGNEFTPFLRLRLSPDRRMHREKEGQVDFLYKMFLNAKDLFIALHDRKAKTQMELLRCLADDTYVLTTINGDDGPFILRLKVPRKQG